MAAREALSPVSRSLDRTKSLKTLDSTTRNKYHEQTPAAIAWRVPPPLPAGTGGGAFGALYQRFQTGDPFSQRADVRAKVVPQIAYPLLDIGP